MATLPEARNGLARLCIERKKPSVERAEKQTLVVALLPEGRAAVDKQIIGLLPVEFGIERPQLLAGFRLQRDNACKRRGDVHRSADHQRSAFERRSHGILGAVADVAGMIGQATRSLPTFSRFTCLSGEYF